MSPTQNPNVTSFMAPSLPRTGFSALVIGCRSGSEVFGLARFGVRVVALEKDPEQFRALALRLLAAASAPANSLKQAAEDEKMGALLRTLHATRAPGACAIVAAFSCRLRRRTRRMSRWRGHLRLLLLLLLLSASVWRAD